jgi:ribosomal protein S20
MPNHSSPEKMLRRDQVVRMRNRSQLSEMKTYRKKFLDSANSGKVDLELFKKAQSLVARAGRKHLIPKGRANRIISRMMKRMQLVEE